MPSSYTSSLRLTLPATGENSGTWGTVVNTGITELTDSSIAGYVSIAMTDADYTLTVASGATDQARRMMLNMTGTLTLARNVICPSVSKLYIIKNSTTGGFAITLKTSAGSGISIPNGKSMLLMCDGSDVVSAITQLPADSFTDLTVTGNTILGDASTDTVRVNGYMGVGGAGTASAGIYVGSTALTTSGQFGVYSAPTFSSAATSLAWSFRSSPSTAAAVFTLGSMAHYRANNVTLGAGSVVTEQHGVQVADLTSGTNNYGITSLVSSGTDKWNIYASGTAANYFAGNVGIGTNSSTEQLTVSGNAAVSGTGYLSLERNLIPAGAGSGTPSLQFRMVTTGTTYAAGSAIDLLSDGAWSSTSAPGILRFRTTPSGSTTLTERMRIDSAGNLGLGVVPSAWSGTYSGALQVKSAALYSASDFRADVASNSFYDGSASKYINTGFATALSQVSGQFRFFTAPSGIAGATTTITSGQVYTVTVLGSTSLAQWQAFFSALAVVPVVGQSITATATGTLAGGATVTQTITFTQAMTLTAAGNLGIGTSSPGAPLHVISASTTGPTIRLQNAGTSIAAANETLGSLEFYSNDASASATGVFGKIGVYSEAAFTGGTGNDAYLALFTAADSTLSERLRIDSAGNVGIGTSSPAARLDVTGAANSLQARFGNIVNRGLEISTALSGGSTDSTSVINAKGNAFGNLVFQTDSIERLRIDSVGNVGIGTNAPGAKLEVLAASTVGTVNALRVYQTDTAINSAVSISLSAIGGPTRAAEIIAIGNGGVAGNGHSLAFATSANGAAPTERLRITSAGDVGIGTTNPSGVLHVADTAAATNVASVIQNASATDSAATASLTFIQGNGYSAGKIVSVRSGNYSATASTQDSALALYTAVDGVDTERMRIDSAGSLGLGGTPSAWQNNIKALEINSVTSIAAYNASTNLQSHYARNAYLDAGFAWRYKNTDTSGASLYTQTSSGHVWFTAPSGTAGAAITFEQSLAVGNGTTLALEGATSNAGAGITFPATQVASANANTLDDYEEGTFTPTIVGTSTAGTGTYTTQVGTYTKIGRLVHAKVALTWTAHTGTGNLQINGLPFTPGAGGLGRSVGSLQIANIVYTGTPLQAYVFDSSTFIFLAQVSSGAAEAGIAMDTSATVYVTVAYEV